MPRDYRNSATLFTAADGAVYTVLRAELEFIWASFASKIPLLALFWFSASMDVENPGEDNDTATIAIAGTSFVVSILGTIYIYKIRAQLSIDKLKRYHWLAAAGQLVPAISMALYFAFLDKSIPNRNVTNTFSEWIEEGEQNFIVERFQVIGGPGADTAGIALPYLPPAFAAISGTQHVVTALSLTGPALFETFSGAWLPRYIDYALSTPLIFITNAYFFDKNLSLFVILFAFATYIVIMGAGFGSEAAWYEGLPSAAVYGPFVAATIAFVLSWITPFVQLDASVAASSANDLAPPLFVYLFVVWIVASFAIFPIITLNKIRKNSAKSGWTGTGGSMATEMIRLTDANGWKN